MNTNEKQLYSHHEGKEAENRSFKATLHRQLHIGLAVLILVLLFIFKRKLMQAGIFNGCAIAATVLEFLLAVLSHCSMTYEICSCDSGMSSSLSQWFGNFAVSFVFQLLRFWLLKPEGSEMKFKKAALIALILAAAAFVIGLVIGKIKDKQNQSAWVRQYVQTHQNADPGTDKNNYAELCAAQMAIFSPFWAEETVDHKPSFHEMPVDSWQAMRNLFAKHYRYTAEVLADTYPAMKRLTKREPFWLDTRVTNPAHQALLPPDFLHQQMNSEREEIEKIAQKIITDTPAAKDDAALLALRSAAKIWMLDGSRGTDSEETKAALDAVREDTAHIKELIEKGEKITLIDTQVLFAVCMFMLDYNPKAGGGFQKEGSLPAYLIQHYNAFTSDPKLLQEQYGVK